MRTILTILVGALVGFSSSSYAQTKTYQGKVSIKQNTLEVQDNSLVIDMDVCISNLPVSSHKSLTLFPVLKSKTDSLLLDPIIINGANKHKMYLRKIAFRGEEKAKGGAYTILEADPSLIRIVPYKATVEMQPWMKEAKFELVGEFADYHDNPELIYISELSESLF